MTNTSISSLVAHNIRTVQTLQGVSMSELAKRTGIARSALTMQVNGQAGIKVDSLARIAAALNVTPADLWPAVA